MTQLNNINYSQYIHPVCDAAPKADNDGQVAKQKKFFEKDAFVETKPASSYEKDDSVGPKFRFILSAIYWIDRTNR